MVGVVPKLGECQGVWGVEIALLTDRDTGENNLVGGGKQLNWERRTSFVSRVM